VATEFKLPDLGEGVEEGEVARLLVSVGDRIEKEHPVLELETDKALVEVPSTVAGTVASIAVKEGDRVLSGSVLITVDAAAGEAASAPEPTAKAAPVAAAEEPTPEAPASPPEAKASPAPAKPAAPEDGAAIPAGPATRRFARELGIDLSRVQGSGPGGRIVKEDVEAFVKSSIQGGGASPGSAPQPVELPDFGKWGEVELLPMRGVRRKIAQNLSTAWSQIPHVTQFDQADVTDLEAFRQRHKAAAEEAGGKLTPTVLILKAVLTALKAFPQFNASLDMENESVILKKYYNIGIAVDTDRGLLVPVVRDVDRKDLFELAADLSGIAERTRTGKVDLKDLQGGTFTISNLGSIGGTAFSPIVNHPEVAILGIAKSREEAVVRNGRIEARLMMPLCLSYDHRVIDGADGARFTQKLVQSLENPERMLLGG